MPVRDPPTETIAPLLALLVVLSGCAGVPWADAPTTPRTATTEQPAPTAAPTDTTAPATPDAASPATSSETLAGEVLGHRVDSVPEGATVVPASDERIDVGGPVWQAIEEAAESGTAAIHIEGDEFREARATLRSLPYSYGDDNLGGVYVRRDDTVVRLLLSVEV